MLSDWLSLCERSAFQKPKWWYQQRVFKRVEKFVGPDGIPESWQRGLQYQADRVSVYQESQSDCLCLLRENRSRFRGGE